MKTLAKRTLTVALYLALLAAVVAMWNDDAPPFIYVAF